MNRILLSLAFSLLLSAGGARAARAQFGGQPGGMGPGGMGPQPMPDDQKEEGPAEEAPEEERPQATDTQPVGEYPGQARKVTQVIELDGYMRLRTDFLHKLHLGQGYVNPDQADERTPPFPVPLECQGTGQNAVRGKPVGACGSKNLGSGNLRLRLEPTINVTDQVRVRTQIDVFDNLILGSTPDSIVNYRRPGERTNRAPAAALSMSQETPEPGQNSVVSSVRAKRAWGEVDTEFGSLRFGRMPWHFGRGIAFNNGDCQDCDRGTTVDRIMALAQVYGHQVALSWDFAAQGYHSGLADIGRRGVEQMRGEAFPRDPQGLPLDLSQRDDVLQLMGAITRLDDERRFADRALQGELMVNYGAQLVYRKQSHEVFGLSEMQAGRADLGVDGEDAPLTRDRLAQALTLDIDALIFMPSLWFKLAWKSLTVEAETTGVFGKYDQAGLLATDATRKLTVRQLGWVIATELRLYQNSFFVGFETGGATGDQAEDNRTYLNTNWKFVRQPPGDRNLNDFKFSPDYHVDQILFRRILGTVTNAAYFKPSMTYWLNLAEARQVGASAAFIYSLAPERVATPGNALSYGVEMNVSLTYRNPTDGFYAGVTWAVLWPMGALSRPTPLWQRAEDATSAQALRTFLGIRF